MAVRMRRLMTSGSRRRNFFRRISIFSFEVVVIFAFSFEHKLLCRWSDGFQNHTTESRQFLPFSSILCFRGIGKITILPIHLEPLVFRFWFYMFLLYPILAHGCLQKISSRDNKMWNLWTYNYYLWTTF